MASKGGKMNKKSPVGNRVDCPLCLEHMDDYDIKFYPCPCGYQICVFCWHRIRTDENGLCPACRKEYSENPTNHPPRKTQGMIALKSQKRQRRQTDIENRKLLAEVRVIQRNLVFVVGLPARFADVEATSPAVCVKYMKNSDSPKPNDSVNKMTKDGRLVKTCHEVANPEAKKEMTQGKHSEHEKRLNQSVLGKKDSNQPLHASPKEVKTPLGSPARKVETYASKLNGADSKTTTSTAWNKPVTAAHVAKVGVIGMKPKTTWAMIAAPPPTSVAERQQKGGKKQEKAEKGKANNSSNKQAPTTETYTRSPATSVSIGAYIAQAAKIKGEKEKAQASKTNDKNRSKGAIAKGQPPTESKKSAKAKAKKAQAANALNTSTSSNASNISNAAKPSAEASPKAESPCTTPDSELHENVGIAFEQMFCKNRFNNKKSSGNIFDQADALAKLNLLEDNNSFFSSDAALRRNLMFQNRPESTNETDPNQKNNANAPDTFELWNADCKEREMGPFEEHVRYKWPVHPPLLPAKEYPNEATYTRPCMTGSYNKLRNFRYPDGYRHCFAPNYNDGEDSCNIPGSASWFQDYKQPEADPLPPLRPYSGYKADRNSTLGGQVRRKSKFFDSRRGISELDQEPFMDNVQSAAGDNREVGRSTTRFDNSFFAQKPISEFLPIQRGSQPQLQPQPQPEPQVKQEPSLADELGFDPFAEARKGLAELIANEGNDDVGSCEVASGIAPRQPQQPLLCNPRRGRIPRTPPGFAPLNTFGFGMPRPYSHRRNSLLGDVDVGDDAGPDSLLGAAGGPPPLVPPHTWRPRLMRFAMQEHSYVEDPNEDPQQQYGAGDHIDDYYNSDWMGPNPSFQHFPPFPQPYIRRGLYMQQFIHRQHRRRQPLFLPNSSAMHNAQNMMNFSQVNYLTTEQCYWLSSRQYVYE